jgi:purine-nucleoside/S-methyl-5'-thioadenosine phosphorylase / adenosine deaminase
VLIDTWFTDRRGGLSQRPYDEFNLGDHVGDQPAAVTANRERVAQRFGRPAVWMNQVHGDAVVAVDGQPDQPLVCDALVTATPGLPLAVVVADCVPVLLADAAAGVVAAAHAGRAGTRNDVVIRTLEAMVDLGAEADRVEVWLGPSVCGRCYEVPEEMQEDVCTVVPAARSTTRWQTTGLDLRAGLTQRLSDRVADVHDVGPCTLESPDHFSHRRDGVTGRTAGVIRFVP